MMPAHPAFDEMRLAIEALVSGQGSIRTRLQAAVPHFGIVHRSEMRTDAEDRLRMRIGSGLVEGGDDEGEEDETDVAESIGLLDESRAVEIASDMFVLYELLAGLRTDDGFKGWSVEV